MSNGIVVIGYCPIGYYPIGYYPTGYLLSNRTVEIIQEDGSSRIGRAGMFWCALRSTDRRHDVGMRMQERDRAGQDRAGQGTGTGTGTGDRGQGTGTGTGQDKSLARERERVSNLRSDGSLTRYATTG